MRRTFETKIEYLNLIPVLAQTTLSEELNSDSYCSTFGDIQVRLYGTAATVTKLGEVREHLRTHIPVTGLRAYLKRIGLLRSSTYGRTIVVYGAYPGKEFEESYSQEIGLRFAAGQEAMFEVRRIGSRGLRMNVNEYLTAIFASTGGDLVPFAFKHGVNWIWLYGDMSERLEQAGVCRASYADDRFNAVAGLVQVTVR